MVTLLNLACGFVSIILSLQGNIFWAANTIFIAYFFDTIDGSVAKLLGKANLFGAELDNLTDGFSFGVAPGFLVFAVFKGFHPAVAYFLGFWLIACSTIRYARFSLIKASLPGYFFGLPRPASALMIAAMVNSRVFQHFHLFISGAVFVVVLGLMNLSFLPYLNHHNQRQRLSRSAKIATATVLALVVPISWLLGYPWEGVFVCLLLYSLHPLYWIRGEEKAKITAFLPELRKELN